MSKEVYNDGSTRIVELFTFQDAQKLPVNNVWCICQLQHNFDRYIKMGCRLFFIDNGDESPFVRYVAMVLYQDGSKVFWDMNDEKIEPKYIDNFLSSLSADAKKIIQNMPFSLNETLDKVVNHVILEYAKSKRKKNNNKLLKKALRSLDGEEEDNGWDASWFSHSADYYTKEQWIGLYKSYKRYMQFAKYPSMIGFTAWTANIDWELASKGEPNVFPDYYRLFPKK